MADGAIKLKLDAGFYKNGTEYQAAGRWLDGDLVRWHNDSIKPINGWQRKADFVTNLPLAPLWSTGGEAVRSGLAVGDTVGGVATYFGTNKKIYQLSNSNVKDDVTPAGFTAKPQHATADGGYGSFRYSYGQYGVKRPTRNASIPMVFSWGFAVWGEWPVACARSDDAMKILIKRPTDADFVPIAASPAGANDVLVTDERFMMTFGKPTDGKLIQWSDQENFDVWAPAIDNQAGSIRVAGTGRLVRGVKVLKQILVLGEDDAFVGQYIGPPYVYGFDRVGNQCGITGPNAVVVTETFAAWLGETHFWQFDGVVRQLECEVLDFLLEDAEPNQRSKVNAFTIAAFSECWWLYQSTSSPNNEPDSYVIYNYDKQRWYTGRLNRTMGLDRNPASAVVMVSPAGLVYDHEIPNAGREGRVPYIETGPLELSNGERLLGVSYVYPDERYTGALRLGLSVRDMPRYPHNGESVVLYERDFELLRPTSTHGIMGRDIRMRLYTDDDPTWVIGDFRVIPIKNASPMR